MAWSGYFMFAGTEIINATRTESYARNLKVGWFRPVYNEVDLPWLLGEKRYTTPLQDDAPWTDPDNLDSYDFYGVYPLEVTGLEDGTVDATVTESVSDGGYIGRTRKKTRTVVFSAILAGASECAVEYGMRWLRSVLTGGVCFTQSYGVCGGADLCYLACPPLMDDQPEQAPVQPLPGVPEQITATNWASNPNLESGGVEGWNSNDPAKYQVTNSAASPITGTRSLMSTRQAAGIDQVAGSLYLSDSRGGRFPVTAGEEFTAGLDVKTENPAVVEATNLTFNPVGPSAPATLTGNHWGGVRCTQTAGPDYLRQTISDATATALAQRVNSPSSGGSAAGQIIVPTGTVLRVTARVRSSASLPMQVSLVPLDGVGAAVGSGFTGPSTATNPTTWTDLEVSGTMPAGAAYVSVRVGIAGTGPRNIGDTFDIQQMYVGTAGAPTPFFEGGSAASGDYTYRWTGAVNASTSERVRANPPIQTVNRTNLADNPNLEIDLDGWTSGTPANYPLTLDTTAPISGTQSAMATRTATSLNGWVFAGTIRKRGSARFSCSPGVPLTFAMDVRTEQAGRTLRTNVAWYDSGGASLGQDTWVITTIAPNVVTRVPRTITPPANAVAFVISIEVYYPSGNVLVGERCWLDNLTVESGTTDGSYFDGSTSAGGGNLYRWTGAKNASTSERYTETPRLRRIRAYFAYDVGGNSAITTVNDVAAGAVTRVVHSAVAPAGATSAYVVVSVETMTDNAVVGERAWYDRLVVTGDATDGAYFDGGTAADATHSYRWRGPVDASVSEQFIPAVAPSEPEPVQGSETALACYTRVGRSLHEVTTTVGPSVTNKLEMIDGGAVWQVTWTMVAANPAEFGVEKPLVVGFLDPDVDIPYFGGVVPEGGAFDENGNVQSDPTCPVTVYRPVYDPTCTLLAPPPDVPEVFPTCFSFPVNFLRTMFTIPRQEIPLWTHVTPVISLTTGTVEARSVRVRFYADMFDTGDPSSDPCNYCGDVVFSYIPPQSTITLDCADHEVYIDQPGIGRRRADTLVSDSSGYPFEWPEFSCGFGYVVTVDMPQQMTRRPVLDLSLVPRMA